MQLMNRFVPNSAQLSFPFTPLLKNEEKYMEMKKH